MNYCGKFIVIEGPGGSGKGTQIQLLQAALIATNNGPVKITKFPRYAEGLIGAMANDYNQGTYGPAKAMPPQFSVLPYIMDRVKAVSMIREHKEGRWTHIADRYWPTNAAYHAAKLPPAERPAFIAWLKKLEFEELGVVREDVGVFLDISAEETLKLVDGRSVANAADGRDVYEQSIDDVRTILDCYRMVVANEPNWHTVHSLSESGEMRSREEIHADILSALGL